jgi:hypothetical protein
VADPDGDAGDPRGPGAWRRGGTAVTSHPSADGGPNEKLCAMALTRTEQLTFRRLTELLTEAHRQALDSGLVFRPENRH